jgi:plastocyanin
MRTTYLWIQVSAALIAAACVTIAAAQDTHTHTMSLPDSRTVEIVIANNKFNDGKPVTIHAGDSIVWINRDRMPHTATSTDASAMEFDTGFIQPGARSEPIEFLQESPKNGFPYECDVHDAPALIMRGAIIVAGCSTPAMHQSPSIHSMLVTGATGAQVFLHHYSLFNNPNHNHHITLEAVIDDAAARKVYDDFRTANGDAMCAIDPEPFLISEIGTGARQKFQAKFSEAARPGGTPTQWGTVIPGLESATIRITRIIQFRMYDPDATYQRRLTYQLYGNMRELYVAHEVTEAPSFQQVIKLKTVPKFVTPDLLQRNPLVTIPGMRLKRAGSHTLKTAVLSNSTHILMSPPVKSMNPTPPLHDGDEITVFVGDDKTPRKLTVGKSIWHEFRILNR